MYAYLKHCWRLDPIPIVSTGIALVGFFAPVVIKPLVDSMSPPPPRFDQYTGTQPAKMMQGFKLPEQ
eukprot:PRCOL_00004983-RA